MRRDSPRYGNFPKRRKSRESPWNRASPAFGKLWEHAGKCRVDLYAKIGARKAAYTSYIFGIVAMVLNLTGNTVCVWLSLVCIGLVVGGAANWPASLCIEEFGDSFANGYGIIQPMIQTVGAVGPAFFAVFYGMTGSYRIPYICGAVLMLVGLVAFALLAKPGFVKKEEEKCRK